MIVLARHTVRADMVARAIDTFVVAALLALLQPEIRQPHRAVVGLVLDPPHTVVAVHRCINRCREAVAVQQLDLVRRVRPAGKPLGVAPVKPHHVALLPPPRNAGDDEVADGEAERGEFHGGRRTGRQVSEWQFGL
jgi:hypothetical protein